MIKKNIPNLFTLANLFCGCIALVFAFEGNLVWSAYLVGIACVLDFLDGMVARLLNVHSEIGKQLDSLADMVSFGVVPGVILFKMINQLSFTDGADRYESAGISFIGFAVTIFSAIRLAKFNLDTRQSDSFIGLPTPANTIFIASIALIGGFYPDWTIYPPLVILPGDSSSFENEMNAYLIFFLQSVIWNPYFLISLSLISSISLVAPIPLFALKFKNFSWADNKVRYIFLALALILLIIFKVVGVPLIIVLYIVLSVINNLFSKKAVS